MLNMTGYWCEVLLLLFVDSVLSSHFMGATIRWKSDPDIENKATFYWKAGWRISRGPCSNSVCTAADIGRLGTNRDGAGGKDMYCHIGCSDGGDTGMLANSDYWITAVSVADNYEMGENEFTHTFAGSGPYKVGLGGLAWRSLSVSTVNNPSWRILTTVIFGDRSDTGRPNNSPMTAAFPIYNLQFDCEGKIKLPLLDPDGDKVRCRWGNTYEECGDVCDALPGVVIDEDTCELTITPATASTYVSDGWYVGAIMLEDFPQSTITLGGQDYTPTDPLSAVPLAFLVKTPTFGSGCAAKPVFVSPTPEPDTVYYLEPFQSIGISMYAVNEEDTNAAIEQIDIVSPSGVVTTELVDDDQGRTGVKYRVAYWTPSLLQAGGNTLCFMALDTTGKFSEYQCVYIYAHDVDECLSDPCQNGGTCNNLENIYTCTCPEGVEGYNCETIGSQLQTVYEGCYVDGPDRAFPHSMVQLPVDNSVETCTSHCFDAGGYEYASLQYTQECWCGDSMELAEIYGLVDESECSHQCPGDVDQFCGAAWRGNLYRIELNCWSSSTLGRDYIGRVSTTVDGIECQRWDTNNDPHSMLTFSASDFPEDTMTESENYCRNPDDDTGGPWCYSKDVGVTWDYCDIPQCIEIECSGCDIDECADSPCHNHGTCIDGDASYTCNCVQGYEGTNCETLTDMCDPQPCQNSGTCYNIIGEYLCICEEGYTGDECQTDIDDCASSPCYNGGTCTDDVAGFSCSCVSGWSGSSCQDYDDPCSSSPCQNGGTCQADCSIGVSSAASYTCVCGRHYSGFHCVEATTTSTTESTTSTSTSTTTTATPTSTTLEPTTTTETDHCASLPCLNDGLCTGYDDGYTCTCLADYCGAQCETEIPPSCYNSHCSCSSNLEWTGFGLDVSCNCTECNSGESNTTTVLEGHTTCYRNIYVLILTGLCGVILSTVCFTTYILVLDLRRRYNVLLNGSNPDVKYNGYGSSTSLRGLIQADSRMSNNSVTKVGVAEKPRQPGNTKTDYDDPQAMMRQYLMNDTSNAFLFSGGQRSTTSSSKGKASGLITIDDGVDSLMEESIREENDDVIKERGENKRKKDKKDKKEKKKTDEKKESKKKDKKERRKGWD